MQKSSLQKIFGSNLTPTAREARGMALAPWDLIVGVKEKAAEGDPISRLVRLYILARTYFKQHC